jgi:glycosyltransferase involved in cell wall biosynthesis
MLVSVCTPTFNRRPFIATMIKCFKHQDYKGAVEWIIVDDGTDKIEDLIVAANIPEIKYHKYDTKLALGKKRNIMHSLTKGNIIVYMDDDDYYPPERISHAVHMLQSNPKALCAGSSLMYIYFNEINKVVQFGPYGPNHATAGTFAFKRELLSITSYNDEVSVGEEKEFLKNYTIPFVQLDPKKVILVCAHTQNTFDKRTLLVNPNPKVVHPTDLTINDFIKDPEIKHFFAVQMHVDVKAYSPGDPSMKPDVLEFMEKKKIERSFSVQYKNQILYGDDILKHLNNQQAYIKLLEDKIKKLELHPLNWRSN